MTLFQRRAGTLGIAFTVFGVAWIGLALAHGGALDRLDAVLFTAVAGYYIWLALL